MIDLSDTTFLIPLRLDSAQRLENAELIVRYLFHHFKTRVFVCEESNTPRFSFLERLGCRYWHMKSDSPYFHRTRVLNRLSAACETPLICSYDCDVLLVPAQYQKAVFSIRRHEFSAVFPYDGRFYDLPRKFLMELSDTLNLNNIPESQCRLLNARSIGGALFWNKTDFFKAGMYNEYIIGWGYEDNELIARADKLGFSVGRMDGPLFHLAHPRRSVDSFNSIRKITGYLRHPRLRNNKRVFRKTLGMPQAELRNRISDWVWRREALAANPSQLRKNAEGT